MYGPITMLTSLDGLPSLSLTDSLLFDVLCALIVHKIYNKYEIDPAEFLPTFVLLVGVPVLPCFFLLAHFKSTVLAVLISIVLFYLTLISSIILYRVSPFHPLAKYPGPLALKVSKLASVYYAHDGKQYVYFKRLHEKYGPAVRVGPNELSIVDVEAVPPVLGVDGMRKGPIWIYHVAPGKPPSVLALRDPNLHRERRKLWNRAFTSTSLKEYQPALANRVLRLVDELKKRASDQMGAKVMSVDMAQWIAYFTYDFMGDMLFGGGFELMRDEDKNGTRPMLETFMRSLGILQHLSWTKMLTHRIAATPKEIVRYLEFSTKRFDMRQQQGATQRDLFHYITNEDGNEKTEVPRDQGLSETFAAIVAGADTTSTVLSGLFFYLLSHPTCLKKLQTEVDSVFPLGEGEPFDAVKLAGMPYLNAVINEALRLQPPLPTSIQRSPLVGSGGKWVAGRFVPENTGVSVPPYILHRDERYFYPSPDEFIPERWLDTPQTHKFVTNAAAFIPFSYGPANCAGKNLALLEMRMVVSALVQRFDMRLADGYDPREWEKELQDYFVLKVGKLPVSLTLRE